MVTLIETTVTETQTGEMSVVSTLQHPDDRTLQEGRQEWVQKLLENHAPSVSLSPRKLSHHTCQGGKAGKGGTFNLYRHPLKATHAIQPIGQM